MEAFFEDENSKIWIENGIMNVSFKIPSVDAASAKFIAATRIRYCNEKSYPTVIDIREVKSVTKEARETLAVDEGIKFVSACAMLINSPVSKIIGNFFLTINKPSLPNRIFTDREEALKWLQQFK